MSKPEKQTLINVETYVKRDSHSIKEVEDLQAESREKVAIKLGMQLLKRKMITFETEEKPGPNAGERRITIKGKISINTVSE